MHSTETNRLAPGLRNRHIQFLALGGTIGTGLFLGSAGVIRHTGPSMLLAYALVGMMIFLIMRFLGEMLVETPAANSFGYFATKYWGPFAGYFAGWNTVAQYVLCNMLEISAAGKFVQFWWPWIPQWETAAACLLAVSALNLASVRLFGETEFWFALLKIVAVLSMIGFGLYLVVSRYGQPDIGPSNLWAHGGFFPSGLRGLLMSTALVALSFGGIEIMGYAAAETDDPARVIPKAINQIVYRVLLFYVGSSLVLLMLFPWNRLVDHLLLGGGTYSASPFTLIFSELGSHFAANALNLVILSAVLSVYNGLTFASSRMMFGMARQGVAPAWLGHLDRRGVPVRAIALSTALTGVAVVLNYVAPHRVIELLIAMVTAALVLIWVSIVMTHLKFRARTRQAGLRSAFPALFSPWSNYLCLAFLGLLVGALWVAEETRLSVMAIPLWLGALYVTWRLRVRNRRVALR